MRVGSLKVWLMNHYASNMFRDKAGRHYWFAQQLRERGYNVTVFCSTTLVNGEELLSTGNRKLVVRETDGIPFVFVKTIPAQGNGIKRIENMGLFYKNLFPATKAYAAKYGKPDVILASSVHPLTMVAGIQIAKRMKIPCICEIRDLWPEAIFSFGKTTEKSFLGRALTKGEHWIYKKANALIFTKEGDTDYLKEKKWTTGQGGDIDLGKCYYINNGVDIAACEERCRTMQLANPDLKDESKFNVTYVGTIRPVNNVGNLLDAAKILKEKGGYDDIQFLIYGDGEQFAELQERVNNEKLDNVIMKGFVNRQYVPYILSKSSINMLNYAQNQYNWTRGNSSNKLFEYMASGKPIISTVHMGYSIIKKYNCGVELDEDTPVALAEQIMRLHDMSKEERDEIGSNAREGANDFDFSVLTEKLIKVIESVV
ncbi:glycosyltransferase family 4 protein [Roseburia hominis]